MGLIERIINYDKKVTIRYKAFLLGSFGLRDSTYERTNGGGVRPVGAGAAPEKFAGSFKLELIWSC